MSVKTVVDTKKIIVENCPVIWLEGLSGSGKSTLAKSLSQHFSSKGIAHVLLDGDELRKGINQDLGFSDSDRNENLRRAAEIALLFKNSGIVPICSFITPTHTLQKLVANTIGNNFIEIFVNCSLEECERRDVKGLYKKARLGEIPKFTGVSAAFEEPVDPILTVNTEQNSLAACLNSLLTVLEKTSLHLINTPVL
ncbi:MAG: adenylyl-sulfate kinase [Bacteroidetes bacterium]|nr:adenylyl-sulfate kinase [Bacteroidota bacterium]